MFGLEKLRVYERLYHPRIFGREVGHEPGEYQEVFLLCPHPRKIGTFGRGWGKSRIGIADNMARKAVTRPYLGAVLWKLPRPMPFRGVLISSVKDQAIELQEAIGGNFERSDLLRSELSADATKTMIRLKNGALITIRPATAGARGQHADTIAVRGRTVRGIIVVNVDEAWHIERENFFREVVRPMFNVAGYGSEMILTSTPYGRIGDVWEMYDAPSTGECLQRFVMDPVTLRRRYDFVDEAGKFGPKGERIQFDRSLCQLCMAQHHMVRFRGPTWENPYAKLGELLAEKRDLLARGGKSVWDQEYRGIPSDTAATFFNEYHRRRMWDDTLPEFKLTEDGRFVRLGLTSEGTAEAENVDITERVRGEFYLGLDANQGIESRRADYAVISLMEIVGKRCYNRMCLRFKVAPDYFLAEEYGRGNLTRFMIDFAAFIFRLFGVRKIFIDQGFGQQYYEPLKQLFGEQAVEYVPTSLQAKMRALLNLRTLIEKGIWQSPKIDWLERETRYLQVEAESLDEDKLRVRKASSWGTTGAEVDGIFGCAYAALGAIRLAPQAVVMVSQQRIGLERDVGRKRGVLV